MDLLLKYLCMALPYGVKIAIHGSGKFTLRNVINSSIGWYIDAEGAPTDFSIDEIRPYLRSMLSMTEEEKKEYRRSLTFTNYHEHEWDGHLYTRCIKVKDVNDYISWLLKNHFDFMDLIPKGLAIETTEDNNPYK